MEFFDFLSRFWGLFRSALFRMDAERAHQLALFWLKQWSHFCSSEMASNHFSRAPELKTHVFGLEFPNPLGLAPGFDSNAVCLPAWQALGFGFIEVGGVTAVAQEGNPRPRIFRLPKDKALLNRMGFHNEGAQRVGERIAACKANHRIGIPIGINIGKSKVVTLKDAPKDYAKSFQMVADVVDYVVINVSSPNTVGLRKLQEAGSLRSLLDAISEANEKRSVTRPLLLKLAPDLEDEDLLTASSAALEFGFQGIVVSNTTTSRDGLIDRVPKGGGGISGRPLFARSTKILADLRKAFGEKLSFVGGGGVFDGATAQLKIEAGAKLIQSFTGFVYGGPGFPKNVLTNLRDVSPHGYRMRQEKERIVS